ncbi:SH3 domain-containing protein [Ferrovibrio sp.]|uniref:SH3 domain-containing protein n=2 Tax=Ferrovibrio sp. TaxID=1917215 RepID=UPI0035164238
MMTRSVLYGFLLCAAAALPLQLARGAAAAPQAPAAAEAAAPPPAVPEKGPDSGLPLPRFVSLAADKVNARTGPGARYPIAWQYQRRHLPVEVTAEYEFWRRIRDHDGTEAWVHKNLTSGRRYGIIEGRVRALHAKPDEMSDILLEAEPGVQAYLRKCPDRIWCQVEIAGTRGWMPRAGLWGLYPGETFD